MISEVKRIINSKISFKEEEMKSINNLSDNELNILKTIVDKLLLVISDSKILLTISEDEIIKLKVICTDENIRNLIAMRPFLSNPSFDFEDRLLPELKRICEEVNNNFKNYIDKVKNASNYEDEIIKLKKLYDKLEPPFSSVISSDIDMIVNLLVEEGYDKTSIMNLIIDITSSKIEFIEDEDENDDKLVKTDLSESDVIDLFNEFGYDFADLKTKDREELLSYGNLDNICEMFITLKKYGIDLNEEYKKSKIISKKSTQITKIFIYSNAKNLCILFDFCISKGITINDAISIVKLLETPSKFINRKRKYKRREVSGDGTFNIKSCGCLEDFINNYNMFEDIYIRTYGKNDFHQSVFNKCPTVFNVSNEKIRQQLDVYSAYGIEPKDYFNGLIGFVAIGQENIFDLAIELGIFDYVKQNMSRVRNSVDDRFFTNIAIANRNNIDAFETVKRRTVSGETETKLNYRAKDVDAFVDEHERINGPFRKYDLSELYKKDELLIFKNFERMVLFDPVVRLQKPTKDGHLLPLLEKLEKYTDSRDDRLYNIGGIKISKFKVLRLYNSLILNGVEDSIYSIMYILTRNSLITNEEYKKLYSEMNTLLDEIIKEKKI